MSWESTASYYRIINDETKRRLGGLHSAQVLLYSLDFQGIEDLQHRDRWDEAANILVDGARRIESGGADFLLICTNTMHKVAGQVEAGIGIPLLHIADATGRKIINQGFQKVALLGTRFTMEQAFYRGRLEERFSMEVLIPDEAEREMVHRVIYDELCLGDIRQTSKKQFVSLIEGLADRGAEAVILGCTEIALLVNQKDTFTPLLDTTRIHALGAVDEALSG